MASQSLRERLLVSGSWSIRGDVEEEGRCVWDVWGGETGNWWEEMEEWRRSGAGAAPPAEADSADLGSLNSQG